MKTLDMDSDNNKWDVVDLVNNLNVLKTFVGSLGSLQSPRAKPTCLLSMHSILGKGRISIKCPHSQSKNTVVINL